MATVPGQLIWEIVKKNNSFLVKEFGNGTASVKFSKEPNNLFNLHSYKHSGLSDSVFPASFVIVSYCICALFGVRESFRSRFLLLFALNKKCWKKW